MKTARGLDCVVACRENVRMSPLAAALPFLMSLSWFATLFTYRCFPFGCGRLGDFLKFYNWRAYQCRLPFLDLYFSLASSLVSLFASIVCKASGICPFNSSFIHFRSALGVEIRVSYISDTIYGNINMKTELIYAVIQNTIDRTMLDYSMNVRCSYGELLSS